MKNCLVTKLNATVADTDKKMEYFGGFIIDYYFKTVGEVITSEINPGSNATADVTLIDGDAYFTSSDGSENRGTKATVGKGNGIILYIKSTVTGFVRAFIKPDENKSLTSITNFAKIDFDKVNLYVSGLTNIQATLDYEIKTELYGTLPENIYKNAKTLDVRNIKGNMDIDLSYFADNTSIGAFSAVKLNGAGNHVHGSIVNFGKATTATNFDLYGKSDIIGSLSALAEAQVANGRTSGTLTIATAGTSITVDETTPVSLSKYSYVITFNSSLPNGYSIA